MRGGEGSTASLPKADSLLAVRKYLLAFPALEVKSSAGDIKGDKPLRVLSTELADVPPFCPAELAPGAARSQSLWHGLCR